MATYLPICLYQEIATRSAVRATPRPLVNHLARPQSQKLKDACVSHFPRIKSDLMIIQRISRFVFPKSEPAVTPVASAPKPGAEITATDSDSSTNCTKKIAQQKSDIELSTPVNQIGITHWKQSPSMVSEMTVSTTPENLDDYRRENSSAGFWSPVSFLTPQVCEQNLSQSNLDVRFPSLAMALDTPEAVRLQKRFAAEGILASADYRVVEDFINDIVAALAAMCPHLEFELLSMRHALFVDLLKLETSRSKIRTDVRDENVIEEIELKYALQRAEEEVNNLTTRLELQRSITRIFERKVKDIEEMRDFLEESTKQCEERFRKLRAKFEGQRDEALLDQQNEATRIELTACQKRALRGRIKQLERAVKAAQLVLREEMKSGPQQSALIPSDSCDKKTLSNRSSYTTSNESQSKNASKSVGPRSYGSLGMAC